MPGFPVVNIRNSFGAALSDCSLFGLTIVQTWIYFWNYRNRDSKPLKFFVAFITFTDALHTIICFYAIYCETAGCTLSPICSLYTLCGPERTSPWTILPPWLLTPRPPDAASDHSQYRHQHFRAAVRRLYTVPNSLFVLTQRSYYAWRVYIVSQSIIYPIIIVVSAVISSFFGIFAFAKSRVALKRFSDFHSSAWMSYVALSAVTVGDIVVAASMCWSLYRRRTGFAKTDSVIVTLMAYSINSDRGFTHFSDLAGIFWAMSKCYVNSLLAMLNSRDYLLSRRQSTTDKQNNAYNISSFRVGPTSEARVSFSVQRTATLDYGRNKSNHDEEPTFEVSKPV
ncbi:hypothetical protein EDB85DRAFT_1891613 [Lactarius pseudohatsudake]|nr:hypothetical protein EDB85DRAFT_1891613 [Lactarius pseudohatsudake]